MHHCVGAPLARLEVGIVLSALFERVSDLTLAVDSSELTPLPSFLSNAHTSLPVHRHRP